MGASAGFGSTARRAARRGAQALVATALAVVACVAVAAMPTAAATGVDLTTYVGPLPDAPVPSAPTFMNFGLTNNGPDTATNVSVVLALPAGVTAAPPVGTQCTSGPSTVTCTFASVPANNSLGGSLYLTFASVGTYHLATSVTADQPDVDASSSASLDVTVVAEQADLYGSSTTDEARPGTTYAVNVGFANNGPTSAGQASVTGTFPIGTQLVPGSFFFGETQSGSDDLAPTQCTVTATGFTCSGLFTSPLAAVRLYAHYEVVLPSTSATVVASATITGRNDLNPANNTTTTTIHVGAPAAELSISIGATATQNPVAAGLPITFDTFVFNRGELAAQNVVLTLSAPAGWTAGLPTGAPEAGRTCAVEAGGHAVHCTYLSLAPGASKTFHAPLTPPAGISRTDTVTLHVTTDTTQIGNEADTVTQDVTFAPAGADLVAGPASHTPATPTSGEQGTVTMQFRNASADRLATGVAFTVPLPAGTFLRGAVAQTGTTSIFCGYSWTTRIITCTPNGGVLAQGEVVTLRFTVYFDAPGPFSFTGTVGQASTEQAPGDESVTHGVTVAQGQSDLHLGIMASTAEADVGETFSYLVSVSNSGPHRAPGVVLTDELPTGVDVVSAAVGWSGTACEVTGRSVRCDLPTLASGQSTFAVVQVRALSAGTVANSPSVASVQTDPDPSSNSATVSVSVVGAGSGSSVDLTVAAHDPAGPFVVGAASSSVYVVANVGARTATGVAVTVASPSIPAGVEVLAATAGWFGRPCTIAAEITCTLPALPPGGVSFVVVSVRPLLAGSITTVIAAAADQADADPATNVATTVRTAT